MSLKSSTNDFQTYAQLNSSEWGIWGKEKYTFNDLAQNAKHNIEQKLIKKLIINIPERLKFALRYSFGICDLNAFSLPISESEFSYLSGIYFDGIAYTCEISDDGLSELVQELYFINKTANEIQGFSKGYLVNETNDHEIWRKYIYLDFFKFSLINILMREQINNIAEYTNEQLTCRLILSYFLGVGTFLEKASVQFSEVAYKQLIIKLQTINGKIELNPEFPDIQFVHYTQDYSNLLSDISVNRRSINASSIQGFLMKRYDPFEVCNQYYTKYFFSELSNNWQYKMFLPCHKKPLNTMVAFYEYVKNIKTLNTIELLAVLRTIRISVDEKYNNESLSFEHMEVTKFYSTTTHPLFQALIYEGKILNLLFKADHPEHGNYYTPMFEELVPFYALSFKKCGNLFSFDTKTTYDLPRIVLAHHVHNANCEKLRDKMILDKLQIWDSEKIFFIVSSSSSKIDIVLKERKYCLELGYTYYRIHGRQHLKAGNQNRAIPNAIDGVGTEYYLTLDDDFFAFPDFSILSHKSFMKENMDSLQAPLAFRGIYDRVTKGEKVDAESMLFFESSYGRNYPRIYVLPRGTGTIYNFTDGKNSLTDTGGFLVDFSSEDFGQGYISLIQQHSNLMGSKKCEHVEGQMTDTIHVIGEGVDLNGKLKQLERWNHGTSKILFHLLIPVIFKGLRYRENKLLANKQFIAAVSLTALGLTFRFMLFSFFCIPFLYSALIANNIQMPGIVNINFLLMIIFVNYLSLFAMYFFILGKVSFNAAIRMVLIEPVTTITAIIGYLKGLFGVTPKIWSANKTRKHNHSLYRGVYILALINIFPIVTFPYVSFWVYFWPFVNLALIFAGLIVFQQNHVPKDPRTKLPQKINFNIWMVSFIIATIFNIWFFFLESKFTTTGIKVIVLGIMGFNFYMGFRSMLLNSIMAFKQEIFYLNLFKSK